VLESESCRNRNCGTCYDAILEHENCGCGGKIAVKFPFYSAERLRESIKFLPFICSSLLHA
jgi:hypothetical protein